MSNYGNNYDTPRDCGTHLSARDDIEITVHPTVVAAWSSQHQDNVRSMHAVFNAPVTQSAGTYGHCVRCGEVEVLLMQVIGTRDYSEIGESAVYPVGYCWAEVED